MNTEISQLNQVLNQIDKLVKSLGYDPIPDFWDDMMKVEAIQNHINHLYKSIENMSIKYKECANKNLKSFTIAREYAMQLKNLGHETYISTQAIKDLEEEFIIEFYDKIAYEHYMKKFVQEFEDKLNEL